MKQVVAVFAAFLCVSGAFCQDNDKPLLQILTDTGQVRDGLPVLAAHPDNARIRGQLSRGFVTTMARLYRDVQTYLEPGMPPEPAYLLFSSNQGGFPRVGFYLNGEMKRSVGYVDLHKQQSLSGKFGAMDQIFPHELGHVIMRMLAGEPTPGGSNQIHAIAVRTDPQMAYQEGFAEHLQVMSIDDPDADPSTKALSSDSRNLQLAERNLKQYRRELEAFWSFATPKRMGFLFWYSGTEQALRYFAVKANAFAHDPGIPDTLLRDADPYCAYLLANIMPGDPGSRAKPVGVMLSTEGVVSSLFYRWVNCNPIRERYMNDTFYSRFGGSRQSVSPLENAYLKLFHAFRIHKPQSAADAIRAYKSVYPEESADVDAIVTTTLLGQPLPQGQPIWLANYVFKTGTSLFDQYRAIPRTHTFDLNAATKLDLMGVPGVNAVVADAILSSGPYSSVADLQHVAGITAELFDRFRKMESDMRRLNDGGEEGVMASLPRMLRANIWRALAALVVATVIGALVFRRARHTGWFRCAASALGVSFAVLAMAWFVVGGEGLLGYGLAVCLFAVPSAVYLAARRRWAQLLPSVAAWALAAVPAKLLTYPLF